jgi:DNA-binding transcriptional LysR family regulator
MPRTRATPPPPLASRLKLRQLALIVALAERRSLRQAASDVAMTQPAATKLLRDLEDAVGVALFTRHAWGMAPTRYGDTLVRHARSLLSGVAQAGVELAALAAGAAGELRVGGVTGAVPALVAPAIRRMHAERPRGRVFALVNTTGVMIEALRLTTLDVALGPVGADAQTDGLDVEPLAHEPLSIVARAGHPLARKPSLTLARLVDRVWLLQPAGTPLRRDVDALLAASGQRAPASVIETVSIVATLALLQEMDAVSVIPRGLARHYARFGMVAELALRVSAPPSRYAIITRAGQELSPAARAFVDLVRAAAGAGRERPASR